VIYGLTKYYYNKSHFCYNSNSILKKVSWEFVRMKRQRRQGTREERSSEVAYWRVLGTPQRARTDSRSSRPEVVRSARVWHLWATYCVYFTGAPPSGRGLTGNDTESSVHMRPEYFDGIQMYEDLVVMAALRWHNLWSSTCCGWKSSLWRPWRGAVCGSTLCTWHVPHSQEFHTRVQYM